MENNKITAIFIDAHNREVTEIEIEPTLGNYYKLIVCDMVEACCQDLLSNDSFIYVDEEGLFNSESFFQVKGAHQPYAGNGILLCLGDEGDDISVNISLKDAKEAIKFL